MFKAQSFGYLLLAVMLVAPASAQIKLSGEITQGGLVIGKAAPNSKVAFDGVELPVSSSGDFVFGFGRDDEASHELSVTLKNGTQERRLLTPAKREYKIQRVEGIAKRIMNPDKKAQTRAKKDNIAIKAARTISSEKVDFSLGFIAPIDGTITGVYGSQRVYNGVPKRPHFGLDYAGKTGDPVKAPAAGKVVLFVADMFYSGGTMIIDHGHGINSTFLHLSKSYVKTGDEVRQGQVVAAVGSSGRATGPHLDWRVNWFDVRLDPALALKAMPIK